MSTRPNRILAVICGYGNVPFPALDEVAKLFSAGPIRLMCASGLYVHVNRCAAVVNALAVDGWDYLLFLDPDMMFPADMTDRVREYTDPVVGGLYWCRQSETRTAAGYQMDDSPQYTSLTDEQLTAMLQRPGLYPIDTVGTGCVAIRRDVLEHWPAELRPMFAAMQSDDGAEAISEDLYFCWRLKQMGVPVKLDTRVCCEHFVRLAIGRDTFMPDVVANGHPHTNGLIIARS